MYPTSDAALCNSRCRYLRSGRWCARGLLVSPALAWLVSERCVSGLDPRHRRGDGPHVDHAVVPDWSQNGHGFFRTRRYQSTSGGQTSPQDCPLTCIYRHQPIRTGTGRHRRIRVRFPSTSAMRPLGPMNRRSRCQTRAPAAVQSTWSVLSLRSGRGPGAAVAGASRQPNCCRNDAQAPGCHRRFDRQPTDPKRVLPRHTSRNGSPGWSWRRRGRVLRDLRFARGSQCRPVLG